MGATVGGAQPIEHLGAQRAQWSAVHERGLRCDNGALGIGQHTWLRLYGQEDTGGRVGLGQHLVLVHDDLAAVRLPAAVAEHGVDLEHPLLDPDVDPARPAHRHVRVAAELVPTDRVSRIGERRRVRDVLADSLERAVGVEGARTLAEAGADADHLGPGILRQPLLELGHVLGPAVPGEAGDERRPGEVVEQEVQGGPRLDLLGHLGGDGGPQVPAGAAPDEPLQTLGRRLGLDLGDVALAAGEGQEAGLGHDRGLPVGVPGAGSQAGSQKVSSSALQAQVGDRSASEPALPGHEHGRRAPDGASPAAWRGGCRIQWRRREPGRPDRAERRRTEPAHAGPGSSQTMFSP